MAIHTPRPPPENQSFKKNKQTNNMCDNNWCTVLLDIDVDKPDKKLIIMYLTELYNYLEGSKAKEREVCTSS